MHNDSSTGTTDHVKTLHEFQKNALEVIRCSLTRFKGHQLVDIRAFYEDEDGEWRPTKKGISVSVELIDELLKGVQKLREAVDAQKVHGHQQECQGGE